MSRVTINSPYEPSMLICFRECQIQKEFSELFQGFRTTPSCVWEVFLKLLGKLDMDKTCDIGKSDWTVQPFVLSQLVANSLLKNTEKRHSLLVAQSLKIIFHEKSLIFGMQLSYSQ